MRQLVLLLGLAALAVCQPALNPLDPQSGSFLEFPLDSTQRAARRAYNAGRCEEAALLYLQALAHDITDASAIYNLACCYGLMKKDTLAALYLQHAFRTGFDDVEWAGHDPDFDSVRASPVFAAVVDSATAALGRARKSLRQVDVTAPALLPCYVRVPDDFDSTRTYPLVIGLHGYGADPEKFAGLYERAGRPPVVFAALRAPYPVGDGFSWVTSNPDDSASRRLSSQMAAEAVSRAVMELRTRYPVDSTYVLGFSQGAGLAYRVGLRYGFQVQGIVCFGGALDTTAFPLSDFMVNAGRFPVFISHGRDDRVVDFLAGEASASFLKRRGFNVTFVEFAGGHEVPEEPLRGAVRWLLSRPAPGRQR